MVQYQPHPKDNLGLFITLSDLIEPGSPAKYPFLIAFTTELLEGPDKEHSIGEGK